MKKIIALLIIIFISFCLFAANEVKFDSTPNSERYIRIVRDSDLYLWDVNLVDFNDDPNWTVSCIEATESSNVKGTFAVTFPATISAGAYRIKVYDGNDETWGQNDTWITSFDFDWDGSYEITLANLRAQIIAAKVDINSITAKLPTHYILGSANQDDFDPNDYDIALQSNVADYNDNSNTLLNTIISTGSTGPWTSDITAADIRTEIDANSTQLASIKATVESIDANFVSDVNQAIEYYGLDHLFKNPVSNPNDLSIEITANTVLALWLSGGDANDWDYNRDTIMDIRDKEDKIIH